MIYRELEDIVAELEQLRADMNDIYSMAENCKTPGDLRDFANNLEDYIDTMSDCVYEIKKISDPYFDVDTDY